MTSDEAKRPAQQPATVDQIMRLIAKHGPDAAPMIAALFPAPAVPAEIVAPELTARLTAWNDGDTDAIPETYTHDALEFQQDLRKVLRAVAVKSERIAQLGRACDEANSTIAELRLRLEETQPAPASDPEAVELAKRLPSPNALDNYIERGGNYRLGYFDDERRQALADAAAFVRRKAGETA